MALRLSAACWTDAIALLRFFDRRPAVLVHQPVGVVRERRDIVARRSRRCATAILISAIASRQLGRALGAAPCVVASIFSRMSEIAFWFLSLSSSVSRSVRRWMRSISSGALLSSAPMPPEVAGTTGQPCGPSCSIGGRPRSAPVELDFADAGEADAVDLRAGALEHRRLLIDLDPHPDELGPVGKQRNLLHLADGNAGEADVGALVEPADALREVDVVAFGRLVREAGEPDDEQQHAGEQRHRHRADHHIVRAGFH